MNGKQKIALWAGLVNLAVMLLFPPFDSFSFTDTKSLVFAGFQFAFSGESNEIINQDVLFLEIVVLLVNVGVAWLLLRDTRNMLIAERRLNYQNAILLMIAANLTIILLFPPFEYFYAITNAVLPTFQGFYFIFSAGPALTIVTPILYLEVMFVLFNGAVLWLLFRKKKQKMLTPKEAMELMREIRRKG
ncbi:MAG: hypothetical protein A2063_02020 [Gallionellales bacterium GWA2_60_142]|jgi:hypothetical protein|nr:MAG: hypothetical protein A2063_02020 [Gallionellales bacterium GWA2_60_142]HCI15142.1 hypothetical protein [Gallionellaceae bacterium]